tara:strand:+ start:1215 stop:2669 length:1455 start_codon:yes stop_codon:yes gene_type:complete
MKEIKNEKLLRNKSFINNEWINSLLNKKFSVYNPLDLSLLSSVTDCGEKETKKAIDSAYNAFILWKDWTPSKRSQIIRNWYNLILENKEDLARIITLEQGKPIKESLGEIDYGASFVDWFAEEAKRIYGDIISSNEPDKRIIVLKQPVGVVAAITPWNFPIAMITRKVAPALAAGCTVVLKPSEDTPLSALALAYLGKKAGFPKGVFNVITTNNPQNVGEILTKSLKIKKISFTGSSEVGKILIKQSSSTVKKLSMELGGNAPFIIFDDADIDLAIKGVMLSKFRNSGQTCICANRIYVQKRVYESFLKKFIIKVKNLKVGSGLNSSVDIGPLINKDATKKILKILDDALHKGAKILLGGKKHNYGNNFVEPTIVTNISDDMLICSTEIFGPVAAIYLFDDEKEIIKIANDTRAGLAAYFYGKDNSKIWKTAEELEYGMVGVNTGLISTTIAPFGGVKESGFGIEGSKYGINEYTVLKYICKKI